MVICVPMFAEGLAALVRHHPDDPLKAPRKDLKDYVPP